jgi:nucleoside-diphosphate-sugar epimerase
VNLSTLIEEKKIIVIGYSGLIGDAVSRNLSENGIKHTGINTKGIKIIGRSTEIGESLSSQKYSLTSESIVSEIDDRTIIINTSWCPNLRVDRNKNSHTLHAVKELDWIRLASRKGARYVSLGSIAEYIDDKKSENLITKYGQAKKSINEFLSQENVNFAWIRIATCFGELDRRDWLLPKLVEARNLNINLDINFPERLLNITHADHIALGIAKIAFTNQVGSFNLSANQWVKIGNLGNHILKDEALDIFSENHGIFSTEDTESFIVANINFEKDLQKYIYHKSREVKE